MLNSVSEGLEGPVVFAHSKHSANAPWKKKLGPISAGKVLTVRAEKPAFDLPYAGKGKRTVTLQIIF